MVYKDRTDPFKDLVERWPLKLSKSKSIIWNKYNCILSLID
jgi:hypothetical protein